jgi:hypothetical protein
MLLVPVDRTTLAPVPYRRHFPLLEEDVTDAARRQAAQELERAPDSTSAGADDGHHELIAEALPGKIEYMKENDERFCHVLWH